MLISVVVPFRNVEKYMRSCLEALLASNYPADRYEILAVDNNSTDGSADIARQYPRVRVLSESRPGAYAARNHGVAQSRGMIIAFTDSDCAPDPDWLTQIALAMSHPDVQLVQGRRRFARESLALSVLSDYEAEKAAYVFSGRAPALYYGYTNNMAVRRAVFDRVGPFVEMARGADVLFVQKVIAEYSCGAVCYERGLSVRHLEVTSAWKWFRKLEVYGRSFRRYSTMADARALNTRERLQVLRATAREYSAARSLALIALLSCGALFYELGRTHPAGILTTTTRYGA